MSQRARQRRAYSATSATQAARPRRGPIANNGFNSVAEGWSLYGTDNSSDAEVAATDQWR
jgi:hypothetical protein